MRRWIRILSGVVLLGAVVVVLGILGKERSARGFPIPSAGAYVGVISLPKVPEATLYVERLREGDTLLVILFIEGFQPQTIFPERLLRAEGEEMYRPLFVRYGNGTIRLVGTREEGEFRGVVKTDNGETGEWRLRRLDAEDLKKLEGNADQVALWVRSRERARSAKERLEEAVSRKGELEERIVLLRQSLADQAALRTRAEERKQTLQSLLTEKKASREKLTKNVETLASEVDLLSRITKRGQAISLERRILQRENRWYEVNWQSEEEIGLEELPSEEAGIDIAKFEQAVRQARETKSLLREREEELRRIRALESGPPQEEEPSPPEEESPGDVPPEEGAPPPKPEGQKDLWNRLFG